MSDIQPVGFHARDIMFLEDKTLKELQDLARKYGLTPVTGLKKQELVTRLRKLIEAQAQTLLDFDAKDANDGKNTKVANDAKIAKDAPKTASAEDKPRRGRKPGSKNAKSGDKDSMPSSKEVFPEFKEAVVKSSAPKVKSDDIFPEFDDAIKPGAKRGPKRKSRIKVTEKVKTEFDPFPDFDDDVDSNEPAASNRLAELETGEAPNPFKNKPGRRPKKQSIPEGDNSDVVTTKQTAEPTEASASSEIDKKPPRKPFPMPNRPQHNGSGDTSLSNSQNAGSNDNASSRTQAPRSNEKEHGNRPTDHNQHKHQNTSSPDHTSKDEVRHADFRDATTPGGRKDHRAKKQLVHDALPESDAPTLLERVREIEPLLGGYLINEGTLEILPDGYGFLRSVNYNYSASPDDIYVSPSQIKRFCLKQGDTVVGIIRPPKVGERYFALLRVEGVNGRIPVNMDSRPEFDDLLPVYPDVRYQLEDEPSNYTTRIIDLFAPMGKGQRGIIVAQPKTGKTTILRQIANAVSTNNPDTKIIILLIDERPEEVTEMERNVVNAEVVASTFDQKPENHKGLAEIVFEKAKRMVESGHDVLLLMDSITRLARAYNICASNTGRTMTGGVDSEALKIPRQLFSSARNIEGGGSLTIIATALVDTGSRMDDVIFEEFKGTGNMEIVLDRRIADRRIYPAIDIYKSGTRKEELFVKAEEREKVVLLRRYLTSMNPMEAVDFILDKMKGTRNNKEFLISMNQ
jgi:transcription termination factor Rho